MFSKDSVLTASEIYTLPINAELAVLSACETGYGKLEKSEGVMSMSRAFQYAGVKSTVMSLWKVPDKETSKLMLLFYKNLKKGFPKDKALQKAKTNIPKNHRRSYIKTPILLVWLCSFWRCNSYRKYSNNLDIFHCSNCSSFGFSTQETFI